MANREGRWVLPTATRNKNGGRGASVFSSIRYSPLTIRRLPQPPRRVREQGVDEAGLRGQVTAQRLRSAILAGHFVEQPLELGDVAVDRLLEVAVAAIF